MLPITSSRTRCVAVRASYSTGASAPGTMPPPPPERKKLQKYLDSGNWFEIAAIGPRATLGALTNLASGKIFETVQEVNTTLADLLASPAPPSDKPALILAEVEDRLARFVEAGAEEEQKILSQVEGMLPSEVKTAIPAPWPSARAGSSSYSASSPGAPPRPSSEDYVPSALSLDSIGTNQAAAEMLQLQTAVAGVRQAIESLNSNTDPTKDKMLKLNVRDSKDSLARRLREISPGTRRSGDPDVAAALAEAEAFLSDLSGFYD